MQRKCFRAVRLTYHNIFLYFLLQRKPRYNSFGSSVRWISDQLVNSPKAERMIQILLFWNNESFSARMSTSCRDQQTTWSLQSTDWSPHLDTWQLIMKWKQIRKNMRLFSREDYHGQIYTGLGFRRSLWQSWVFFPAMIKRIVFLFKVTLSKGRLSW